MTPGQLLVLLVVAGNEGVGHINIADTARLDRSTVGDIIRRLRTRNWVSSRRSATNARTNAVCLTKRGQAVLTAVLRVLLDIDEQLKEVPPAEAEEFMRHVTKGAEAFRLDPSQYRPPSR